MVRVSTCEALTDWTDLDILKDDAYCGVTWKVRDVHVYKEHWASFRVKIILYIFVPY